MTPPLPDPYQPWREQVFARADVLDQLATSMGLTAAVAGFLSTARAAAADTSNRPDARRARMERAFAHLDGAEAALLAAAPELYRRGRLPSLVAHAAAHLPPANPQRLLVEQLAKTPPDPLTDVDSAGLVTAFTAASSAARREHMRLRSFRNIVILTFLALLALAVGVASLGAQQPAWIPLCFAPQTLEKVVCPTQETALRTSGSGNAAAGADATDDADPTGSEDATATAVPTDGADPTASAEPTPSAEPTRSAGAAPSGETDDDATGTVASRGIELDVVVEKTAQPQDVGLVMLLGLVAAAVTGAAALRRMRGTSTPFSVPVALLLLKLPLGALTAVVGLLLLAGGFVPGFSALDSSGQILAWALVFGASQQLVTGLVDKKAQSVIDSVGSAPMTTDRE